ncbi:MAG TPA: hypothetical protein VE544_02450 [Nitrososphaeraceae archaeon]|nr:hypothetical protein [Nitrososphaeraceae archaeon]
MIATIIINLWFRDDTSISNTRLKLEEAEFFLDFAEKIQDDVKIFGFFINAFFAAAASIRADDGVMVYQYRKVEDFRDWLKEANERMNAEFPSDFWIVKTRNGVIHREGNIQSEIRTKVSASLRLQSNKDGSMSIYRDDPPADNRLRFAARFDEKEGGNLIVDRCWEYLTALKQMVSEWENRPKSLP